MKNLTFYDHKNGIAITVKNPKSRKDAWQKIWDKHIPKEYVADYFEDVEDMIESCNITEVDGVSVI